MRFLSISTGEWDDTASRPMGCVPLGGDHDAVHGGYDFHGRTLVDRDGEKIGTVDEVYTDQDGGQPEWALVHTGLFGTKKNFVPLRGAVARRRGRARAGRQAGGQGRAQHRRRPASSPRLRSDSCSSITACPTRPRARPRPRASRAPAIRARGRRRRGGRGRPRRLRPHHRRRDDALRGGAARRHARASRPAGCACASTSSPRRSSRPCRSAARRSASSASRSPTPTSTRRRRARRSPRRSTRSSCTRRSRSSRSASCRRSACAWTRTRSPSEEQISEQVRKEQIDVGDAGRRL